jgi:uncharacterized protein (UPF0335 family)
MAGFQTIGGNSKEQIKAYVDRVEKLNAEKADIALATRDVFSEAKGSGFDVKALKEIIKLRKKSAEERAEEEYQLEAYKRAMGMSTVHDSDSD